MLVDVVEEYTGHVEAAGTPARRTLDALSITKMSVGPMDNNAYLLVCSSTNEALLIDAANDAERLSDLIGSGPGRPTSARRAAPSGASRIAWTVDARGTPTSGMPSSSRMLSSRSNSMPRTPCQFSG